MGSSSKPELDPVKTKTELWGGDQPLSHPCHSHLTLQCLNAPGESWEQGLGAQRVLPCANPTAAPQAQLTPLHHLSEPIPNFDSSPLVLLPFGFTPGMGRSELSGVLRGSVSHKEPPLSCEALMFLRDEWTAAPAPLWPFHQGDGMGGTLQPGPLPTSAAGKKGSGTKGKPWRKKKNIRGSCTDGVLDSWVGKGGSGWGAEQGELRSSSAAPAPSAPESPSLPQCAPSPAFPSSPWQIPRQRKGTSPGNAPSQSRSIPVGEPRLTIPKETKKKRHARTDRQPPKGNQGRHVRTGSQPKRQDRQLQTNRQQMGSDSRRVGQEGGSQAQGPLAA